ncbi:MAG TPA: phosphotransferase family protein [Ilumatobacteraceae bacterium]
MAQRATLDVDRLQARLSDVVHGLHIGDSVRDVCALAGGASSLTYRCRLVDAGHDRTIVVKAAPPGLDPIGHRDVLRQARVLRSLAEGGEVPVPAVLFEDPGDPPAVPPLFAMTWLSGDSVEPQFDRGPLPDVSAVEVATRAFDGARLLAAMQRTRTAEFATESDRTDLPFEIDRWATALHTAPAVAPAGWCDVHEQLRRTMPAPLPPVLTHGDFRLGNMLATGANIGAVIDWELWSVADPRIDLAWYRLNADPETYGRSTPLGAAMPTGDDLLAAYVDETGDAEPADVRWFDALARFKSVATWSLILKHAERAGDMTYTDVGERLPGVLDTAAQLLGLEPVRRATT